jgi:hypothetical protein
MVDPQPIFWDMAQTFKMPIIPDYVLGSPNPPRNRPEAVATTDPNDAHMEFADLSPDANTVAHEFFHVIHLTYGRCPRADCEDIAYHFADWYTDTERVTFACERCGYPCPEADDWTMCFNCATTYIENKEGEEEVQRLFSSPR